MPPSEPPIDEPRRGHGMLGPTRTTPTEAGSAGASLGAAASPPGASWDPLDDETAARRPRPTHWTWHSRPSWGRRAVTAFPVAAVVAAVLLVAQSTAASQRVIDQVQSVPGSGGATLLVSGAPQSGSASAGSTGQPSDYHGVTFTTPSSAARPIPYSTSLSLPPYAGWEANGSAGPSLGEAVAAGGLLQVGVSRPTTDFRGWFLTATAPTPASCTFQFVAESPPTLSATPEGATGELVMAVQTADTVATGDIDYVVVAEMVHSDGSRTLTVGYSVGHLQDATEHVLKEAPWSPGPLTVSIETNGSDRLVVWVDGTLFFHATDLRMGIAPPFEPYLEVQARQTAYRVAFRGYSSACQPDLVVSNVTDGTLATLGGQRVLAHDGVAVFRWSEHAAPVTGALSLLMPGGSRPTTFSPHTYWPGDRLSFEPGT